MLGFRMSWQDGPVVPDYSLGGLLGSSEAPELDMRSLSVAFLVFVATVCSQN